MDCHTSYFSPSFPRRRHSLGSKGLQRRVLDAGLRLLEGLGPEKITLRAIAKEAGVGTASLYHYFIDKEELLVRLGIIGWQDLHQGIKVRLKLPDHASPIRSWSRAFTDFAETYPALFAIMMDEQLKARHSILREAEQQVIEFFEAVVGTDARVPAARQPEVTMALWAFGCGMAAIAASYPRGQFPPEYRDRLLAGVRYLIDRDS